MVGPPLYEDEIKERGGADRSRGGRPFAGVNGFSSRLCPCPPGKKDDEEVGELVVVPGKVYRLLCGGLCGRWII
jgi:hypothetical protein